MDEAESECFVKECLSQESVGDDDCGVLHAEDEAVGVDFCEK